VENEWSLEMWKLGFAAKRKSSEKLRRTDSNKLQLIFEKDGIIQSP
jgi:hypothetical protein